MKEKDNDLKLTRNQFLKIGFWAICLGLLAVVFGFSGCKEEKALKNANHQIPVPQVSNFIGDTKTKVFHKITCKYKPTKNKNNDVVYFDSPVAAERAGYKPCRICKPNQP